MADDSSFVNPYTGHLMQPTGFLNEDGTPEYLDVTGTEINKAGGGGGSPFTIGNLVKVGLAYALPIMGEAIAAELAVSSSVGTALAAVGTGVAQGQSIEQAITSAAPALVANGIMSQVDVEGLKTNITNDKQLQNVITNVANSTLKTAIAGGDAKDILTNAIATGGGTLIGQTTGQTIGQGLATTLATGDIIKGAQAAAGSAGQEQATINAIEREVAPIMNAPASKIDAQTQAIINQLGLIPQDPGVLTAANAPPNLAMVAASALPEMLGTGNEKAGPIQSKVDSEGNVTYSRVITGVDANGKEYQYIAEYDPQETKSGRQVSYTIPGIIGSSEEAAPSASGTTTSFTRPTFDVTPETPGFSTPATADVNISTAGVSPKGDIQGLPAGTQGDAQTAQKDATGPAGKPTDVGGPGTSDTGLGDIAGTGGAGVGKGLAGPGTGDKVGLGTGGPGLGVLPGVEDGGGGGGGDVGGDTSKKTADTVKGDTSVKTGPLVQDSTDVSITTGAVKPKIKAAYPTISGQFASPLTQAVSAYRPPGEIESQQTGKEKEPVWNVESLRNALGI